MKHNRIFVFTLAKELLSISVIGIADTLYGEMRASSFLVPDFLGISNSPNGLNKPRICLQ